jgi:formylglycine-generating enzyme required for sulfatase activity
VTPAWLLATLLVLAAPAGAEMVRVPAGSFTMGRDDGPADERPAHRVTVAAFEIDRRPVTNGAFARFLDAVGPTNVRGEPLFDADDADARIHRRGERWLADAGYEEHPVVEASWAGARDYCAWTGARLPTEAEWEYAARGAGGRPYPWGAEPPDATRARFAAGWNATAPVDAHPAGASPFGVLGMAGNVWQWVSSAYRPYPYRPGDGREEPRDVTLERVTRGGGHDSRPDELTTTHRGRHVSRAPRAGHHNIGFRCAR